jgi:DNA-binding NarL/FixJ family response regulator
MAPHQKHNPQKISVIILEDNRFEIVGMMAELKMDENVEIIKASPDPDEVLIAVKDHQPDVVFVDLKIQGNFNVGITVIQEIKAISPAVKCVVLTAFPELQYFLASFDAGAEGFVRKDALPSQQPSLADLCRIVIAGGRYYDPYLVGQMRAYLDLSRLPLATPPSQLAENPLTTREQEVLAKLVAGKTSSVIAKELVISENTVKTHLNNIKAKLGARNRHEAILIALARGWLSNSAVDPD